MHAVQAALRWRQGPAGTASQTAGCSPPSLNCRWAPAWRMWCARGCLCATCRCVACGRPALQRSLSSWAVLLRRPCCLPRPAAPAPASPRARPASPGSPPPGPPPALLLLQRDGEGVSRAHGEVLGGVKPASSMVEVGGRLLDARAAGCPRRWMPLAAPPGCCSRGTLLVPPSLSSCMRPLTTAGGPPRA